MGIISSEKKFVFVHIPKTGGNSLQKTLLEHGEYLDFIDGFIKKVVNNDPVYFYNHMSTKHCRARDIKYFMGNEAWESHFTFCTIRNPWDRLVSAYFFIAQRKKNQRGKVVGAMSFDSFARTLCTLQPYGIKPFYTDSDDNIIVDRIIRTEDLNQDYNSILQSCNVPPINVVPHVNTSEREHYSHYYNDELIEIVRQAHKHEIEMGGYEY